MSDAISSVTSVPALRPDGIAGFASNVVEAIRAEEVKIHDSFTEGMKPSGDLMKLPDHVSEQFKLWEQSFTSPEDLALVAAVKSKVIGMTQSNADYIARKVEGNVEKIRLEIAMKAVSKSTQGIQQLLSSQ